jgi:hypothetical protein
MNMGNIKPSEVFGQKMSTEENQEAKITDI